jgi:hypothetical protein
MNWKGTAVSERSNDLTVVWFRFIVDDEKSYFMSFGEVFAQQVNSGTLSA